MGKIQRALLSVTDKTGVVDLAQVLAEFGVELISTGGTARQLREAGLKVKDVAEVTGFPEMLGGRVKTMHPRVTGGILAARENPEHMTSLKEHAIPPIDLVVVNLYAFEKIAARADATLEELIENIDIGGPALIRSAAKNFHDVAVVTDPEDYPEVIQEIRERGGEVSAKMRWQLARKAFAVTAAYDRAIARTLSAWGECRPSTELPAGLDVSVERRMTLRYGENPHQAAGLYADGGGGIAGARQLHGKELSYNNLVDLDAAWQLVREFEGPAAAIIKHTNPCGCAEQETLATAYSKALACDPVSAFGGVLAFNRILDGETARAVAELFTEAIAAPGYSPEALEQLRAKKNLRLIEVVAAPPAVVVKSISGGFLVQSEDSLTLDTSQLKVVTDRAPTNDEMAALEFAWKVVKHVKSNAIVFAVRGQTVGVGAGQMSRVDSVRLAAAKAVLPLKGTVVASDAFFPFPDGVEETGQHGATAIIQPGGSVRDQEVIAAANRLGLAMVFTGIRHFRH
jgi:phosphoribosylaminoimidazolecarboxamide formyltransferase/IMP cyclohydrolase